MGKSLQGTKSHDNLKGAFAGESQANRRYLYFARRADIEGFPDIGGLFRDTSEAETGHAFGHLDFLKEVGDPATGVPIGNTEANLKSAVEGETYEYTQMYPGWPKQPGMRDSLNLPNGSRHWRRQSGPMRIASRRGSTA